MIEVERFAPREDHGRPKLAEFRGPWGRLAVHCDRLTGSLWLFANGPRGGSRGEAKILPPAAPRLVEFIEAGGAGYFPTAGAFVRVVPDGEGEWRVTMGRRGALSSQFRMDFDERAARELLGVLREWAAAIALFESGGVAPLRMFGETEEAS